MKECGDAFQYTATISQYFTIPELFAIKQFMYTHDVRRLLQWAHQRYDETGLLQSGFYAFISTDARTRSGAIHF